MSISFAEMTATLFTAVVCLLSRLLLNILYWFLYILFYFIRGILGLEDRSTSAFSWLVLLIIIFLYYDGQNHDWLSYFTKLVIFYRHIKMRIRSKNEFNDNGSENDVVLENQINDFRETEPLNRQLEAENRENENEENDLVEADRHRIDDDNRRNVELENDHNDLIASLENHQNVERERMNSRMTSENRRNRTQEQNRYFLRQRNRNSNHVRGETLPLRVHSI